MHRRVQQGRADESGECHGSNHSISPMERDEHGKAKYVDISILVAFHTRPRCPHLSDVVDCRFELAVCRYEFHRGGAGNVFEHWEIRDLDTMHRTIDHVQSRWMTKRMILHCEPAGYVQVRGFQKWYKNGTLKLAFHPAHLGRYCAADSKHWPGGSAGCLAYRSTRWCTM